MLKHGDEVYKTDDPTKEIGTVRHIIGDTILVKFKDRREKVQIGNLTKYVRPTEKRVTEKEFDAAVQAYKFGLTIDAGPRTDIGSVLEIISDIAQGIKNQLFTKGE